MSKIKELREKQAKAAAEAREHLDQITDDVDEARAKELETSHDKAMAEYDRLQGLIDREEELSKRQAALEEAAVQPPHMEDRTVQPNAEPQDEEKREKLREQAFRSFLRFGASGMDPELRKVLNREMRAKNMDGEERAQSTSNSAGGYTIPQGFSNELVESLKMWGPMLDPGVTRQIVTASGNQIDWPTLDDTANQAYRLNENTQVTGSDGDLVFGNKQLDAYKYASGAILVSDELMQDSAFNIEAIVRDAMATRFGRKVNNDLTVGDGNGDPNGIVTASSKGYDATLADGISLDDLLELQHSVDPAYRMDPSVAWMFNDTTLKKLRKIKDLDGNYIWQPADARTGAPASLFNYRYAINQAMPNVADSQKSVLFGAMNRYIVRRVQEISIRRLVERYADYGQVGFIGFARFDGELMDTAAVKHLLHPATN